MRIELASILVSLTLLLTSSLAGAQAVGGGGAGGGGLIRYAANPGCEEGRRAIFHETDPRNSDRMITVMRTCRGGSYYDLTDYVYDPRPRCGKEGQIRRIYMNETEENRHDAAAGARLVNTLICRNGYWVKVQP